LHRPVVVNRAIEQRQHAAEAIADDGDIVDAGILLHAADAIRDEVEDVVLHAQALFLRLGRVPVHHVDVVAALEQEFDEALPGHHVEDVAAVGGGHHDQDRHAVDFIRQRPVVIELQGAAAQQHVLWRGAERGAGGREIFDALDAALDRALHLGLDPIRDGSEIKTCGRIHFCSPSAEGGRLVRGGICVDGPPAATPDALLIWASMALISLSWPSIDCSRSAMPTICARLGRFMLTRYFSIHSPSCFCAPAVAPPTWFITLENSGEAMASLARELNPFSISPIMFCHIATGSLLLSAIGAPSEIGPRVPACVPPASLFLFFAIPHRCGGAAHHSECSST